MTNKPEVKIHLKDILDGTEKREEKIFIIGDKKYWADRTNKDNFATHDDCSDCGVEFKKHYTHQRKCHSCLSKKESSDYEALPLVEWDGKTPLVIYGSDTFFNCSDDLLSYCEENEVKPEYLRLCLCKYSSFRQLDWDIWADDLHEDWEPSKEHEKKLSDFNEFLSKEPTNTYFADKKRVNVSSKDIGLKLIK